jgi:hypothetical protein
MNYPDRTTVRLRSAERVAAWMAEILGWSGSELEREIQEYKSRSEPSESHRIAADKRC